MIELITKKGNVELFGNKGQLELTQPTGGGTSITVDDELSLTSTNPVQNKVITEELQDLKEYLTENEIVFSELEDGSVMIVKFDSVQPPMEVIVSPTDEKLSATSIKPIANKAVTEEFDTIKRDIKNISQRGISVIDTPDGTTLIIDNGEEELKEAFIPSIDAELSTTSTNPVQNKMVSQKINEVVGEVNKNFEAVGQELETINSELAGLDALLDTI